MPILNPGADLNEFQHGYRADTSVGKRPWRRKNFRDNTRYDRKVAKLTQPRPNGFGN